MGTDDLTYAYLGDLTKSRDDKGFLHIKGLASDDTLDLDGQICDPAWLEGAMSQWFKTGNIREMHQLSAVGTAHSMTQKGTGFEIEAKIVDPVAALKFDEGVYTGLSIGIKGARIDTSKEALKRAPEGVIVGGRIVEISGVDLPANPSAVLELVKTVGGVTQKTEAMGEIEEEDLTKADAYKPKPYKRDADETVQCPKCDRFNDTDAHFCDQCGFKLDGSTDVEDKGVVADILANTEKFADLMNKAPMTSKETNNLDDSDFAYVEPGGTKDGSGKTIPRSNRHFPIHDAAHVRNALARAPKSPFGNKAMPKILSAAKKMDVKVSKALESVLNKSAEDDETHDPAQLGEIRSLLVSVIEAELNELESGSDNEMGDLYQLLNALGIFLSWWGDEADEGETEQPFAETETGDDTMAYIALGVSPDLVKSATSADATDEAKTELRAEIVKALGLEDKIVTKAELQELREANTVLKAAIDDMREMAAPGQPALRAMLEQQNKSAEADDLETKAARFRATAMNQTDKETAAQYMSAATDYARQATALRSQPF